jgi:fumarate reductase subunit C
MQIGSSTATGDTASVGARRKPRASRWPARLDLAQSLSGLVLALFMWGHMFFVSSILLGKDAMWRVTRAFEGYYFFGKSYPIIVSVIVAGVMTLIVLHALLAMRKFPGNFRQARTFVEHRATLRHEDTTLWWVQAVTGFALFFLAFPHLHQMLFHPADIGPYESADRVWSSVWWPLYLVLLFAVELHGGIGLYRLAVKWGWLAGEDANATRRKLKIAKWAITVFFLALGLTTLAAYMRIGYEHRGRAGERYVPATSDNALPFKGRVGVGMGPGAVNPIPLPAALRPQFALQGEPAAAARSDASRNPASPPLKGEEKNK